MWLCCPQPKAAGNSAGGTAAPKAAGNLAGGTAAQMIELPYLHFSSGPTAA
jgi:hypothetical protein